MKTILVRLIANAVVDCSQLGKFSFWDYYSVEKWLLEQEEYKELIKDMKVSEEDFDKIIRILHESTHDEEIREKLLAVYEFKNKILKK